jgi:signal peptidase I
MAGLLELWRNHQTMRRARAEAKHLVGEARRVLRKKRNRIPEAPAAEIRESTNRVQGAAKGKDLDQLRNAMSALDQALDKHAHFARKSSTREYAESIGVALGVALLLRAFVVEAFQIPSGSMIPTLEVGDHIFVSKFAYSIGVPFTNSKIAEFKPPARGDVIVFKYPRGQDTDYIKRVIGLPGDRIEVRDNVVLINGKPMERAEVNSPCKYEDHSQTSGDFDVTRECTLWIERLDDKSHNLLQNPRQAPSQFGPMVVPPRSVFVMGDNRDNSNDSRVWGTVPFELIKGRALIVWWSRDPSRGGLSIEGVGDWFKSIRWRRFFGTVE